MVIVVTTAFVAIDVLPCSSYHFLALALGQAWRGLQQYAFQQHSSRDSSPGRYHLASRAVNHAKDSTPTTTRLQLLLLIRLPRCTISLPLLLII